MFLVDAKLIKDLSVEDDERVEKKDRPNIDLLKKKTKREKPNYKPAIPKVFSFSQLTAYAKCPRQYLYSFILKVPTKGSHAMSFGKTMHSTMQKIFEEVVESGARNEGDEKSKNNKAITLNKCLEIYVI